MGVVSRLFSVAASPAAVLTLSGPNLALAITCMAFICVTYRVPNTHLLFPCSGIAGIVSVYAMPHTQREQRHVLRGYV